MKILKTAVLVLTIVFAVILWLTGNQPMQSQSAFALEPNNHWYWLMHLSIFTTFILDAYTHRRLWSFIVAMFVLGIVAFDMYAYPFLHDFMTATMALLAVGNVMYYASPKERAFAAMNCFVGALFFILGLLSDTVHLFFGEVIIEFALGVAIARRIWRVGA